jgi:CheY-like chemotaxis protein
MRWEDKKMAGKKILIVEDNELLLNMLRILLTKRLYHVVAVASGKEAMGKLSQDQFDAVLLDINLPDISGWEVLAMIRSTLPSTEVLMITASSTENSRCKAFRHGAFDLLEKPFSTDELNQLLNCMLNPDLVKSRYAEGRHMEVTLTFDDCRHLDECRYPGMSIGLSERGMLILTDNNYYRHLQDGSKIEVRLRLPDNRAIAMQGELIGWDNSQTMDGRYIRIGLEDPPPSYLELVNLLEPGKGTMDANWPFSPWTPRKLS